MIVPETKSNAPRKVHLFGTVVDLLETLPKPPDHEYAPRAGYVFWHGEGEPHREFANYWWNVVHDLLGMKVRNHDLRHFYAWLFLRRGGTMAGLKSQLGHADITTTEQYSRIADDLARADLGVMGEQVPAVDRAQFNVRFSFAECGDFLDERGAQAGSRAVFAHPG